MTIFKFVLSENPIQDAIDHLSQSSTTSFFLDLWCPMVRNGKYSVYIIKADHSEWRNYPFDKKKRIQKLEHHLATIHEGKCIRINKYIHRSREWTLFFCRVPCNKTVCYFCLSHENTMIIDKLRIMFVTLTLAEATWQMIIFKNCTVLKAASTGKTTVQPKSCSYLFLDAFCQSKYNNVGSSSIHLCLMMYPTHPIAALSCSKCIAALIIFHRPLQYEK
ncbi:hypothetical protein BDA99DRAFT_587316 [Phascolomyces articulosus]|uniref:Uncharacterized protein n=1 Tax=Phascolomyces articulosus TaxID=60185 RepID=A0AAD5JTR7_9FUNG|nr:hypothetical protein BDA99DRAFT_587316 [Phascolomyces articulosus]